jgi:hypothetical protein
MKIRVVLLLSFWILFFNPTITSAQNFELGKGKAVIYFESNTPVIVRLDTLLWKQTTNLVDLKEGKYILRAWAPTKKLYIDTITIFESKTTIVTTHLKNTDEYNTYRQKQSSYKFKRLLTGVFPFSLTMGYSAIVFSRYQQNKKLMNQHFESASIAANNYENATSSYDVAKSKQEYDDEKIRYSYYRTINNKIATRGTVTIGAALVATVGLFYIYKKIKKPTYTETPLLTLNSINVKSDYPTTCSIGCVWNIR